MSRWYKRVLAKGHPKADRLGHVTEHVIIAERALGRHLPAGAEVHHFDENRENNANRNLVICQDKAYHKLLHARAKTVRAGGDPNSEKFCRDCQRCRPFDAFNKHKANKWSGLQPVCRDCQKARFKTWSAA